jgi:hypothetical protein
MDIFQKTLGPSILAADPAVGRAISNPSAPSSICERILEKFIFPSLTFGDDGKAAPFTHYQAPVKIT